MEVTIASLVSIGLLACLCYGVYLLVGWVAAVHRHRTAVRQWPGLPIHWLYGNIHQHPMFKAEVRSRGGEEGFKFHVDLTTRFPKGFYFFTSSIKGVLVANHPDIMGPIMKRGDPKPLQQGQPSYNFVRPWLGDGLLLAKGARWFRNRRLLTPAFHFDILKPYLDVYHKATDILLAKMDSFAASGESFEMTQHLSACTLDILLRCVFSQVIDCQTSGEHPYVRAVDKLTKMTIERCFNFWHYFDVIYNLSSKGRDFHKNCNIVHEFADKVIKSRRLELERRGGDAAKDSRRKYLDFLDILLSARDEEGLGLSDLEIRNEVDTFLFEGHDTSASSLTWLLYCLARHPEHQEAVRREVREVLSGRDADLIEWEDLGKFKYLAQCLKEALRCYPPVPFIQRVIQEDIQIAGKILPAGTTVDMAVYDLHHNPEIWPDHMEFNPDRFSAENVLKIDPFSFLPFAAGPRNCIGQNFAMNEEKVVVARILHRFHIELDPDHEVVLSSNIIMKAHHGIKIRLTEL